MPDIVDPIVLRNPKSLSKGQSDRMLNRGRKDGTRVREHIARFSGNPCGVSHMGDRVRCPLLCQET